MLRRDRAAKLIKLTDDAAAAAAVKEGKGAEKIINLLGEQTPQRTVAEARICLREICRFSRNPSAAAAADDE